MLSCAKLTKIGKAHYLFYISLQTKRSKCLINISLNFEVKSVDAKMVGAAFGVIHDRFIILLKEVAYLGDQYVVIFANEATVFKI